MSKCHFLNDVTFLCGARSMIFTMVILFLWKSGHVILHHKSETFNYDTVNDDKRCVISVSSQEGIYSQSVISDFVRDKICIDSDWYLTWFNIFRINAFRATSSFRNLQCKADKIKFSIFDVIRVNKNRREIIMSACVW